MWSFGCIVFELLTSDLLFRPEKDKEHSRDFHHLYWIQQLIGKIPKHIVTSSERKKEFFDKKARFKYDGNIEEWNLQNVLIEKYSYSENDSYEINEFIMEFLKYSLYDRITSINVLNHKWINNVNVVKSSSSSN